MLNILDRYLLKTVLASTLLVGFAVTAIAAVIVVVQELERLSDGGYGIGLALLLVLLEMPQWVYDLFPVMALLGTLMGLGTLAAGSELVVMRAAGISLGRLSLSVAFAGVLFAAICFVLGEWVAPAGLARADDLRVQPEERGELAMTAAGAWLRDGQEFINIQEIVDNETLRGLRLFDVDSNGQLRRVITAETAQYREEGWRLINVKRSDMNGKRVTSEHLPSMSWNTGLAPDLLRVSRVQPDRLSVAALFDYVDFLQDNDLDSQAYELAFWRKIAAPVTVVVMVLLSLPFSIGPLRSTGAGQRLFVGVLVGVAYFLVNMIAASTGQVYRYNPLLAAWLPTAVLALATFIWVRRLNSPGR